MAQVGVGLAVLVGGWWTLFGLLCGWRDGPLATLLHLLPGLLILAAAWAAWRQPLVGGLVLLVEVLVALLFFRWHAVVFVTLQLPLLVAAVLVLVGGGRR